MPLLPKNVKIQQDAAEFMAQPRRGTARPCPVCPASSGVIGTVGCPACHKSGKVLFTTGERIATQHLEFASKNDPSLSASNRRRYHVTIICTAPVPENSPPEAYLAIAQVQCFVWAYSSEKAMVRARDAALWDGVPRPFSVTVSRTFLVEDEVIQRTRSTCDEDKGE